MRIFLSHRIAFGDERILKAYEVTLEVLIAATAGPILWVRWLSRETVFDVWVVESLLVPIACVLITVWCIFGNGVSIVKPYHT